VFERKVVSTFFELEREKKQQYAKYFKMRNFMIHSPHQISLGA
jgi:hypothetical protein